MMDIEKHNENHIREAIKETGLEQPSSGFLYRVMQKIEASDKITAYKPLISGKGWLAAAAIALTFIICSFYLGNDVALLEKINIKKLSDYLTPDLSGKITLSTNMLYGLLFTSIIILLQIPILKSWHNKAMWRNNS